jgi:hypothetical protein
MFISQFLALRGKEGSLKLHMEVGTEESGERMVELAAAVLHPAGAAHYL